eukprot:125711-Amphidinium_carterae.1
MAHFTGMANATRRSCLLDACAIEIVGRVLEDDLSLSLVGSRQHGVAVLSDFWDRVRPSRRELAAVRTLEKEKLSVMSREQLLHRAKHLTADRTIAIILKKSSDMHVKWRRERFIVSALMGGVR